MRGLIVAVACCGLIAWAGRKVWEELHPAARAARELRSSNPADRVAAARQLWEESEEPGRAIRPLVAALRDPEVAVRIEAAGALGTLIDKVARAGSDDDAVRAGFRGLIESLEDREPSVRAAAARSLQTLAFEAKVARTIDVQTLIDALAASLDDPDEGVRQAGLRALAEYARLAPAGPPAALVAAMKEGSAEQRTLAIGALARFPVPLDPHLEFLLRCLEGSEPTVRHACWSVFSWHRSSRFSAGAIPQLVAALDSRTRIVRSFGAEALELLVKEPRAAVAIPSLLSLLREPISPMSFDAGPDPVPSAARALGRLAPGAGRAGEVIAALAGLLRSDDSSRRAAAADALGEFGPAAEPAVPALIRAIRDELARQSTTRFVLNVESAARALGRIAPGTGSAGDAVAVLTDVLEPRARVAATSRIAAIGALGAFGPTAVVAIPRIREYEKSQEFGLKPAAWRALAAIEVDGPAGQGGIPGR
jgi:HEAT repeat protein